MHFRDTISCWTPSFKYSFHFYQTQSIMSDSKLTDKVETRRQEEDGNWNTK